MSPDDPWAELNRARDRRMEALEQRVADQTEDIHAVQEGNRKLAETQGRQHEQISSITKSVDALWKAIDVIRTKLDGNTMALLAFAFTIAAGAILMAFTLGKHG